MFDAALAAISYQPVQRIGFGPLAVSPHGLGTAGGFVLGAMLMARFAERRGIERAEVYNAVTWGAVGALIGSRGFYVLAHLDDFTSVADMLAVWRGGLTMFGGFAGGLAMGVLYMVRNDIDVVRALDAAAPGFVAGVAVGRVGDLVIGDHLGEPTRFALGYRVPSGAELAPGFGPPVYVPGAVVHQTALYDLLGVAVLGGALALIARRGPRPGTLFAAFATWYGLQRLAIDFTRNRDLIESSFFGLSGSQWAGLVFASAGAALFASSRRSPLPAADVVAAADPDGGAVASADTAAADGPDADARGPAEETVTAEEAVTADATDAGTGDGALHTPREAPGGRTAEPDRPD